jgi:hypothetical protein
MVGLLFIGCIESDNKSDDIIQKQQESSMKEMVAQTGLPAIRNFQEKKMMKMLLELRDQEDLVCHAYFFNQMTGSIGDYIGPCMGYGLPASTQYSNPEKRVDYSTRTGFAEYDYNIAQAEPNGLFMPTSSSATWLMLIDPKTGDARAVYVEPPVIVSPFKLK